MFTSGVLEAGSLARKVVVPILSGGTLEFVSEGRPRTANNDANHAVWGDPVLIRQDVGGRLDTRETSK